MGVDEWKQYLNEVTESEIETKFTKYYILPVIVEIKLSQIAFCYWLIQT